MTQPIKTFNGHLEDITSLTFSSSLITSSWDRSIKLWQVGALLADPVVTGPMLIPPSAEMELITLQTDHGAVISYYSDGVVRVWDLSTGLCKLSLQTPATGISHMDTRLINSRLVLAWWAQKKIHIWDAEKQELLQTMDTSGQHFVKGIKISGDGSKVFCLMGGFLQAWSIWTGEAIGEVQLGLFNGKFHNVDGSSVWVHTSWPETKTKGWDFGIPGPHPVPLLSMPQNKYCLHFIDEKGDQTGPFWVEDTVTSRKVLQLPARFFSLFSAQWDGQYLVACCESGEPLILDFNHVLPNGSKYL